MTDGDERTTPASGAHYIRQMLRHSAFCLRTLDDDGDDDVIFAYSPGDCIWLIIVAAFWGLTNPMMKRGGQGIERVHSNSKFLRVFDELKFLVLNWKV